MARSPSLIPPVPGADLLVANKSYLREAFQRVFDDLGGPQRLLEWAADNDQNYLEFLKLVTKMQPREAHVQVDRSIEAVVSILDERTSANVIDVTPAKLVEFDEND